MTRFLGLLLAALALFPSVGRAQSSSISRERLDALFDGSKIRVAKVTAPTQGLDAWLAGEKKVALAKMLANVSPAGAAPGAVAASPSHRDPDYWFNWKRDAALTMSEVVSLHRSSTGADKERYLKLLTDYASFTRKEQQNGGEAGIGEPKSEMDGSAFRGPWGRPQDDGPAEEASTLIALARELLDRGEKDEARALWGDFTTGIKGDLEYVSHRWQETSFDVWEEVEARHFDTRLAQRRALLEGAWLSEQIGDPGAGKWYREQAAGIEAELARYWDPSRGYLVAALDRDGGLDYKGSGLDSAVILGVIHAQKEPSALTREQKDVFGPTDPRVLATAYAQTRAFHDAYKLNRTADAPGVAIGRYPEDRYFGGNPWILSTAGFAELYYAAALRFKRDGAVPVAAEDLDFLKSLLQPAERDALKAGETITSNDSRFAEVLAGLSSGGDAFLSVVRAHADADGSLAEQFDRSSGSPTSARDLTWSYASLLTAVQARDALRAP